MSLKSKDVESKLVHKFGFSKARTRSDDHRWYEIQLPNCPPIVTKFSHGAGDLSPMLEQKIAKQLRVRVAFLREMIQCTKSSEEYVRQVQSDPYPPFDVRF